jgi:hypothetical protein
LKRRDGSGVKPIGPRLRMDVLRPTTWLLSLGLHAAFLAAFVDFAGDVALESGSGSAVPPYARKRFSGAA